MKAVLSPEAVERLEAQIAYLREVGAEAAAERLGARVLSFLQNHLSRFPHGALARRSQFVGNVDSQDASGALVPD